MAQINRFLITHYLESEDGTPGKMKDQAGRADYFQLLDMVEKWRKEGREVKHWKCHEFHIFTARVDAGTMRDNLAGKTLVTKLTVYTTSKKFNADVRAAAALYNEVHNNEYADVY